MNRNVHPGNCSCDEVQVSKKRKMLLLLTRARMESSLGISENTQFSWSCNQLNS